MDEFLAAAGHAGITRDSVHARWEETRAIMDSVIERRVLRRILNLDLTVSKLKDRKRAEYARNCLRQKYGTRMTAAGLSFP